MTDTQDIDALVSRLDWTMDKSCICDAMSGDPLKHHRQCRYRLAQEAITALRTLQATVAEKEAEIERLKEAYQFNSDHAANMRVRAEAAEAKVKELESRLDNINEIAYKELTAP